MQSYPQGVPLLYADGVVSEGVPFDGARDDVALLTVAFHGAAASGAELREQVA